MAIIRSQQETIDRLQARVTELEARLGQNSSNSSQPPSSDPPGAPGRSSKPSGRARGGQPGHKKHFRALIAADQVTAMVTLRPSHCEGCGHDLDGTDPAPVRHQVIDIPRVVATVTEYQLHRLACPGCGNLEGCVEFKDPDGKILDSVTPNCLQHIQEG